VGKIACDVLNSVDHSDAVDRGAIASRANVGNDTDLITDLRAEPSFFCDFPSEGIDGMLGEVDATSWKEPSSSNLGEVAGAHEQDGVIEDMNSIGADALDSLGQRNAIFSASLREAQVNG